MYMVRPSSLEMDTFSKILGGMDGAAAWGWDSMFLAMKKVRSRCVMATPECIVLITADTLSVMPFALTL